MAKHLTRRKLKKILHRHAYPMHARLKDGRDVVVLADNVFLPIPPPARQLEFAFFAARLADDQHRDVELALLRKRGDIDKGDLREIAELLLRAPLSKTGS